MLHVTKNLSLGFSPDIERRFFSQSNDAGCCEYDVHRIRTRTHCGLLACSQFCTHGTDVATNTNNRIAALISSIHTSSFFFAK